jgi:hypothetical protein
VELGKSLEVRDRKEQQKQKRNKKKTPNKQTNVGSFAFHSIISFSLQNIVSTELVDFSHSWSQTSKCF